ncbi:DUF721 domain-containing protein [Patescibacteria group bacterium]|nr:DUF721 domain-containing protein [Patescibacteria group bacterium]MBU4162046.1 DUF721 domain-containing protein [Patescibacteria group bacterium]
MFEPISRIISKRADRFSFKREILAVEVCQIWPKIIARLFNKETVDYTKALSFRDGVLIVRVQSPALMQEFQIENENIIASLNREARKNIIQKIIYKM